MDCVSQCRKLRAVKQALNVRFSSAFVLVIFEEIRCFNICGFLLVSCIGLLGGALRTGIKIKLRTFRYLPISVLITIDLLTIVNSQIL